MGKKISNFLKGEIVSSVFYIAFGLCLILIPDQTVNIICKVIFGLVMIAAGIYHIAIYAAEKEKATILDLFTGVIVLVLGVFLFFTPQIVVKILPYLLGAFVLVDSIWKLKGSIRLKKMEQGQWKVLLAGSIIFIILGGLILFFPFVSVPKMLLVCGCILTTNGVADLVFLIILKVCLKKGKKRQLEKEETEKGTQEEAGQQPETVIEPETVVQLENVQSTEPEPETEEPVEYEEPSAENADIQDTEPFVEPEEVLEVQTEEAEDVLQPEWKDEEQESPGKEIREMLNDHEEPLEEWKD